MFSEILKDLRAKKNTTQGQLAKAVGVSPGNVGDWETGKSKPGYAALAALTRYFEVTADYLLELESDPHDNASNDETLKPVCCDGVPLTESETDLVAMYRLLNDSDREDVFDFTKLKYEKATGKKESIYSTFSDAKSSSRNGHGDAENAHEIA
ncbi:MAG TPA: helix-turn-helix transcriptional regulator [Ruminiclostridium sp.]|nr:helix-turn-helix transcriptional regulator [Ruminiclostridium sp.]